MFLKFSIFLVALSVLVFSLNISNHGNPTTIQTVKVHAITCNNYLVIQNSNSYATVGEIDITGTQLTVEGFFSRDSSFTPEGYTSLNVVSKHLTPADVNYLLRVDRAEITTTNGYFVTPAICETENKKTYHVAMVYDGSTLKFYRNGFLMSEVNCTGSMIQNNWPTTIGATAGSPTTNTTLIGYLNEIRIWNIARSQADIRSTMNNPLTSPTSTPGLLGYYTFDDLSNKQGNSSNDITLHGNAAINEANPSCNFVIDSCTTNIPVSCNNWLKITNDNDYASIGDLDITGNQITVEASFNADTNYFLPSTVAYDLVSKHTDPSNCNYLLRPVTAEITTTNGFYQIIACDYKPKKINHAALVYDGTTLKFYRNGFLLGSKPASGNLITNDLITKIGNYAFGSRPEALKGYINEVRIWNVARTQNEIKTYMNVSLPSPAAQPGLVAYYTFDDLLNKQGNATYNAAVSGTASIGITNPNCITAFDSCGIIVLPVRLSVFNAALFENKKIKLSWKTEGEYGIAKYIIQRSATGKNDFINIATVNAYSNSSTRNEYSFVDDKLKVNVEYYYRLQIIENTGEQKYSVIRSAKILGNTSLWVTINPNPTDGKVEFETKFAEGSFSLEILNISGSLIERKNYRTNHITSTIDLSLQPTGIYLFVFRNGNNKIVKKIIKQ